MRAAKSKLMLAGIILMTPTIFAATTLTCPPVSSLKKICGKQDGDAMPYPQCLALRIGNKISFEAHYQWQILSMRPASFNQPINFYAATINEKGVGCIYSNSHRHYFYLGLRTDAHVKPLKSNIENHWHDNTDGKHHADDTASQAALTGENQYFCISQGDPIHCPMTYTKQPTKQDAVLVQSQ